MKFPKYTYLLESFGLSQYKVKTYQDIIAENTDIKFGTMTGYPTIPESIVKKTAMSYLGTPVFDNIIIDINGVNLRIDTVLLSISQTKNIVKTAIQGMSGTIKEYIADGDYSINIKGMITSENSQYPRADVTTLVELCKRSDNIRITSNFLQLFGISDIVIESYSFNQDEIVNTQSFEINAVSDMPQEIIINSDL